MLLRASSEAIGGEAAIEGAIGAAEGDGGVPSGAAMVRFSEAVTLSSPDLEDSRRALLEELGAVGFVEVAATVGIFNGLVRVADSTGIPLDEVSRKVSEGFRDALGLVQFASAQNTDLEAEPGDGGETGGSGSSDLDAFLLR